MKLSERGLTHVTKSDLEKLFRAVYRGEVGLPLSTQELARVGLQHCAEALLGHLRGLDGAGVRAVVVAVLAERAALRKPRLVR